MHFFSLQQDIGLVTRFQGLAVKTIYIIMLQDRLSQGKQRLSDEIPAPTIFYFFNPFSYYFRRAQIFPCIWYTIHWDVPGKLGKRAEPGVKLIRRYVDRDMITSYLTP